MGGLVALADASTDGEVDADAEEEEEEEEDDDDDDDEVTAAWSPGLVGFALTGRSWWSVGFAGSAVSVAPGLTLTNEGEAVMTS